MKVSELARLAVKSHKFSRAALPMLGFAICAFCLCFSGAIMESVKKERSQPCELSLSAGQGAQITGNILAGLRKTLGVKAASPMLSVPVTITTGKYTANLTLTGITAKYLGGDIKKGKAFPESSAMPYIVLNEAACKLFSDGSESADTGGAADALPDINWLNASFTVRAGGGRSIKARVCGVMAGGEGQEPKAYISLSSAKQLLSLAGQSSAYTNVLARLENIGYESDVMKAAASLGLAAEASDGELQKRWDDRAQQMSWLLAMAIFALLCACVLLYMWKRMALIERRDALENLLWLGMRKRDIGALFALQSVAVSFIGAALGIFVAAVLPSFLPQELAGISIFTLPVPAWAAGAGAGGSIIISFFFTVGTAHIR